MLSLALAVLFATGAADAEPKCVFKGTLTVNTASGARQKDLTNTAVVYVKWLPRKVWPAKPKVETVVQKDRQFSPKLLVVLQHDSVKFVNDDKVEHSVFANDMDNGFDLPRSKKGETGTATFGELGAVRVQCDIHQDMRSDVLIVQNPAFSVVSADGSWRIPPLPVGDYELGAWEISGNRVQSKKLHCEGELNVELPPLTRAKEEPTRHKNGQEYLEYK